MDKQGPLNVTCIHASHRCCFIVATGAVHNDVPKAYFDILQYMKDILRFYHNIL